MAKEDAARIRVCTDTVREAITNHLYENDRHGYFEVSVGGESQGWFLIGPRRAVFTTPERIEADPVYGPEVRKVFEDAIVKIDFEDWAEFFDTVPVKREWMPVSEFMRPLWELAAENAINDKVLGSAPDKMPHQSAADTYDWMGGTL